MDRLMECLKCGCPNSSVDTICKECFSRNLKPIPTSEERHQIMAEAEIRGFRDEVNSIALMLSSLAASIKEFSRRDTVAYFMPDGGYRISNMTEDAAGYIETIVPQVMSINQELPKGQELPVCYEVTGDGFNGDTDETDHLIKWVLAPDDLAFNTWYDKQNGTSDPRIIENRFGIGIDIELDKDGNEITNVVT